MRTTLNQLIMLLALMLAICSSAATAASEPAGSPGTITIAPASITYFARAGDTLSSIAAQFTTRRENWVVLGTVNRIDKDISIPIGTGILIPADLLNDEPTEAKVVAMSGAITVKKVDGETAVIGLGAKITEGMQIETGNNGFLTLLLPDMSRVSLPSKSRVKLTRLRMTLYTKSPRTELTLLRGKVESQVSPLESNKGKFEVRSPHSVAGVRGTRFRVGITESGTTANEVLEGKVALGKGRAADTLLLPVGKGAISDSQGIGSAVDLLPAPQLATYSAQQKSSAQFTLVPLAGAHGYHVQIATDREAQNMLAEAYAPGTTVKVDGVTEGDYFVRISALDKAGLEGFTDTKAVSLRLRAAARNDNAPAVAGSTDKEITLRWPAQAAKKFNLQVGRGPDFSWLLFSTSTTTPEARMPRPAFGTYYARVQTVNADGSLNPFSAAKAFIVTDQWVINDDTPVQAGEARSDSAR